MNRLPVFLTSAAALPLLADASLKGAVLLVVAGLCALLMRRASAAARHMVWLAAVLALLLLPVLAVVLPGWRVLPQWVALEPAAASQDRAPMADRADGTHGAYLPPPAASPAPLVPMPPAAPPPLPPLTTAVSTPPAPGGADSGFTATALLLPVWSAGCAVLLLRLSAAHLLLRRNTRRCTAAPASLTDALAAAQRESGLRRPVRLLMDDARTIPVVWGVFRPTLLLPAEALTWDAAPLRSVLLHELAHLRRRDPLVQFLTQIACALHWFNPLVWLAAWRLHVERERACDDMVLASGVRPSTYAEHLLGIATQLSPACWTQACGLAMARKSSLEGRLTAVLSDKLNRRRLTRALTAAAILLSAAIAVPIAMLRAQDAGSPAKPSTNPPDMAGPSEQTAVKPHAETSAESTSEWSRSTISRAFLSVQADRHEMPSTRIPDNIAAGKGPETHKWTGDVRLRMPNLAVDAEELEMEIEKPHNTGSSSENEGDHGTTSIADLGGPPFLRFRAAGGVRVMFLPPGGVPHLAACGELTCNAADATFVLNGWPEVQLDGRCFRAKTENASIKLPYGDSDSGSMELRECMLLQTSAKPDADALPHKANQTVPASIEPRDPDFTLEVARYYEKQGRLKLAMLNYREYLSDPTNPGWKKLSEHVRRLIAAHPELRAVADHGNLSTLPPATEAQLDWGDPVNGLRGAIIIRPTAPGAEPGIFLAVQNVSDKPLRFADTIAAEGLRKLYVSDARGVLFALTSNEPTGTDVTLQPREVAFLRVLEPTATAQKNVEPEMIEGLRKYSLQRWRAMLDIHNAPDGAWKGQLTTGETRGAVTTDSPQPKDPKAQALFKVWQDSARLNGDIPGGLVSVLHDKVKEFIRHNEPDASGAPYAAKMKRLEPRFGELRDWKPADVVALLDDIAAANTSPLNFALMHLNGHTLHPGQPLPAAYAKADWGAPLESGLRMACILDPQAAQYHVGTEVEARIVLHNSGKEPVAFVTQSFQQPAHSAKFAGGGAPKLYSDYRSILCSPMAYRLAPGECCAIDTPGIGIGVQNKDRDDWVSVRTGSWILCSEGDEVIFSPGPALLSRKGEEPDTADWWLEFITQRLERETPLPLDTKEREYLLYRVVSDLFGTAPSTTEGDAFNADKSPDTLKNLAALLTKHAYGKQAQGTIQAGETKFRVLPPDPDAAKRVRVASNPGYYNLSDTLKFSVTRRPQGSRIINEASLIYFQQGKDNALTNVELPDAYNTWAAAMEPGTPVLWIKQKDLVRRYDFTDPAQIKETRFAGPQSSEAPMPARVLEAMRSILAAPDAPVQQQNSQPPSAMPEKKTAAAESPKPRHEYAQSLFKSWQANARSDGKIPGALIGLLAEKVDEFTKSYTGAGQDAVKLAEVHSKLDATRDWTPAEAVALLDEIAAINHAPLGWAEMPMKFDGFRDIKAGQPLPKELEGAAWGTPAENGLRAAWLLGPSAEQYAHGTVLKARVLYHNAGKEPVVFQTETWHQYDDHKALDTKGAEISVKATRYTGITPMATFRLAPGEYCEVTGHGLAIGAGEYKEEFSTGAVGAIIEAKDGDTVTLSHTVDASYGGWTRPDDPKDPAELRKKQIAERIAREAPLPVAAADRELLLRRVTLDLTGVAPTPEEIAAFTADKSPDALANLTARLQNQPAVKPWSGQLPTGETKFRVLPADPDATDKPKTGAVKLSPESLIGAWRGTVNGEKLMLSFHRPPAEKDAQCDIYFGEATIGVPASFAIAEDGGSAAVVQQSAGGGMKFGTLIPDEAGKLKLELYGRQQGQQETMLTRDAEPPVSNERKSPTQPKSGAQLDRAKLEGTWEGEKEGATVKVEFQWLSEHQQVRWEVKRPGSTIAAEMSVVMAPDGTSADFIFRKGLDFEATQGRVTPGEGGTLNLEIIPNPNVSEPGYPTVKGLVLKRNPDGTVPKTSEAGAVR